MKVDSVPSSLRATVTSLPVCVVYVHIYGYQRYDQL
jgi:hypothetical protein